MKKLNVDQTKLVFGGKGKAERTFTINLGVVKLTYNGKHWSL